MRAIKIGVVAPGSRIDPPLAECVAKLAAELYGERVNLVVHPQCFLVSGHFAGNDAARSNAFLEMANDASFDALWIARGGYGSCRIVPRVLQGLTPAAAGKIYLGYSDAGSVLGALYGSGMRRIVHGPMPADILRSGGEAAVARALAYLVERSPAALDASVTGDLPTAAFNLTILSHLLGTPFVPDLAGHVVMLEDVSEHLYRIDRALCQVTSNPGIRGAAGLSLGRVSDVPPNDPPFGQTPEDIIAHWCAVSGIPYLGHADIGHDIDNKIVPFGKLP
jgi:muramoyltetrapeptide carboxypeptidase